MMREVQRVLKVGGYYFAVSYGLPENRLIHFERAHLSMEIEVIKLEGKSDKPGSDHFVYVLKKKEDADEKCIRNWDEVEKQLLEEEERERALAAELGCHSGDDEDEEDEELESAPEGREIGSKNYSDDK
eukprot:TRINITY_DN656_c0_g1_i5.p2 TRINITY_DN656_c0_g1~~TRINITY_DN656_c0_g1_i5.p2  ORF type:complete len:129 (+),score=50.21 TRINITY_DN656_c0_g1_i5:498-884(+)